MDSITQAALGAAVAYGCWHRQLGRRALVWGFTLGTLPDLDVLIFPWLDAVDRLILHRGESHSIWTMFIGALLLAPLVVRIQRNPTPPRGSIRVREAFAGVWLVFASHVLIDVFTVYGTQLLAPFSRHGFGLNNLFIIDPLYTVPLLLGILLAAVLRTPRARHLANVGGLALSTLYVAWSFVAQARAAMVFSAELARQGHVVAPGRAITSATPLNTLLWRHVAEVEGGFLIGYWSWLDADTSVKFDFVPRDAEAVSAARRFRAFRAVEWFSQGFWAVLETRDGAARVADLRFAEIRPGPDSAPADWSSAFAWSFPVAPCPEDEIPLVQIPPDYSSRGAGFADVWKRLKGDRSVW